MHKVIAVLAFVLAGLLTKERPQVKVRPAFLAYQGRYFASDFLWALGSAFMSEDLVVGVAVFIVLTVLVELRRQLTNWAK